jgi:endonuclease YncB( thermonuclease family)
MISKNSDNIYECIIKKKIKSPFCSIGKLLLCLLILMPIVSQAALDESYGVVTNVVDGDTFDVTIQKADSRIVSGVERVRLADINSPELNSPQGSEARDFAYAVLMNRRIFLDIDDLSANGRDNYGRLICVAYLSGFYGQPLKSPNFNRMLVDSGYAKLENFTNNEFYPDDWWSDGEAQSVIKNLEAQVRSLKSQLSESAGKGLNEAGKQAVNWILGQI